MNKVYRVIWNAATGTWAAVQETAKACKKSSRSATVGQATEGASTKVAGKLFAFTMLGSAVVLSGQAFAATVTGADQGQACFYDTDSKSVICGDASTVLEGRYYTKSSGSVLMGLGSTGNGESMVVIGRNSKGTEQSVVAIGESAVATTGQTIAIGSNANAVGLTDIMIGKGAGFGITYVAGNERNIGIGDSAAKELKGNNVVAVGSNAAQNAQLSHAVAIGSSANINAQSLNGGVANYTVAVGRETVSVGEGSTALGAAAKAYTASAIAIGQEAKAGLEAGAPNVAADNAIAIGSYSLSGRNSVALGRGSDAAGSTKVAGATAIGTFSSAQGNKSSALGFEAQALSDGSIAIGQNSVAGKKGNGATYSVAVGTKAEATNTYTTATGWGAKATGYNATALGKASEATHRDSVALGSGSTTVTVAKKVDKAEVNGLTYDGFAGHTNVHIGSQVSVGAVGSERQIKNVAPGQISNTSTDAINGSQLYATNDVLGNVAKTTATHLGGGSTVGTNGSLTAPTYNVVTGSTTPAQAGNSNQNFTTTPANNVGDALTNLNTYINQGFKVVDNAGATKGVVTPGESVKFANGTATTATVDTEVGGVTTVKYDVKVDNTTVKVDDKGNIAAVTAPLTTNTDGKVNTPAAPNALATAGDIANAINNSGWKATSGATGSGVVDGTTEELINPSETVTFQAGDNMVLNQAGNVFTYSLNKDININSVQFNDGPKITNDGDNIKVGDKDGNATKITNVAAGTGDTDAVNVSQLKAAQAAATTKVEGDKGVSVTPKTNTDGSTTYTVAAKTDGITTKIDDKGNIAAVTTTFTPSTDGKVGAPVGNGDSLVTANTVANAINNSGWKATSGATGSGVVDGTTEELINPSETVTFQAGDNMVLNQAGNVFTYSLNKDININSVQFNDGPKITNDGDNIKVGDKDGNATKITNVAAGTGDTDAVNVSQLKAAQAAATTKVEGDKGVSVTPKTNTDGSTTYTVAAKTDGITTKIDDKGNIAAVTTTFTPSTDGKVGAPVGNGDSLVTANTVANAINNSGWKATSGATGSGVVDGTTEELINPSETVTFQAGDNMVLNQAGNVFTYSLNKDIDINSVQIGANGPKITNDGNNIKVGDKDGNATKITNVKAGEADTDAVNVSQLEKAQAAATTKVEEADGIKVVPTTNADGSTTYTVSAKTDGTTTKIDGNGNIAAVTTTFTPSTDGKVGAPVGNGDSLVTANTVANAINNSGWKLAADGTTGTELINPSDIVTFKTGSSNLTVKRDGANITYDLARNINVDSVQIGANGPTIKADASNNINIAKSDGSPTKITNVEAGTGDKDAVNVSQLKAVEATANKGWNLTTNGKTASKSNVKPGDTVDFANTDGNVKIENTGNNVIVNLNKDIDLTKDGSVTIGNTKLNNNSLTVGGANKVTVDGKTGIIKGLTNTTWDPNATYTGGQAATQEQLKSAGNQLTTKGLNFNGNQGDNIHKNLGDTLLVKGSLDNKADASSKNLRVDSENGELIVKISENPVFTTVQTGEAGDRLIVNKDGLTITNVGKATVSLTEKGLDNGNNQIVNVASGLTKDGKKVELKDAEGNTLTNAVNVGDLKEAANNLVTTGFNIADGKGGNDNVKLGETVTFVDPAGNIITTVTDNKVEFGLNSTLSVGKAGEPGKVGIKGADGKDAISLNGKDGTIGINGKDGANATLTVEKAKPALDGKDGQNGENGQTRIVYTKPNGSKEEVATLNDGLNFKADDGSIVAKKLNETLEIVGGADKDSLTDNNIGVNNKNGKLTVQLAKDLKGIDSITVNNGPVISGNGIDMKGDKITNIKAGTEDNDAVNVSQLKAVEATANKGWNLTTNGKPESKSNVKPGDTVDFANEDGNVKIENKGNNVIVNLNKDIDLTKDGSVTIGDTKVNNDGLTIAGGPSVTKSGIDAGDKKITNVAPGKISADSKDAINGSQLYTVQQAAVAAKTEVKAGDNVEVKKESGGNGQDIYTVSAKDTSASVTAGSDAITVNKADPKKVVTVDVTDYKVDLSQATKDNIQKGVDAKGIVDNKGLTFAGDNNSSTEVQKLGSTVNVNGDSNITTQASGNTVKVTLNPNVTVESLTATNSVNVGSGNAQVALTTNVGKDDVRELSVGSANAPTRITNVARGVNDTDAVNLSQLKDLGYNINTKIDKVEKEANAGIASAMAMETAPFIAGKWTYAVGAAYHGGEQAVGATLRKTADNGRWSLTGGVATGTEGDPSVRIGISGVID